MLGFWLMLFAMKLNIRKDISKNIKEKHEKDISDAVRLSLEILKQIVRKHRLI